MAGIFISYRHNDNDVAAGRLADDLSEIFGRDAIFRDVNTLEAGEDYTKALDHALEACGVLIVIISPRWLNITDNMGNRRLEDPNDWVRIEIKRAIERGIRLIPVLITAEMPQESDMPEDLKPLIKRQAFELSDKHWRQDIELLTQILEKVPGIKKSGSKSGWDKLVISGRSVFITMSILSILFLLAWLGLRNWDDQGLEEPADLSQWIRIRNSGPEGSVAGLAVVTAMEARLAQQKRPVSLSARYLYEKTKSIDRFETNTEGTDMTAAIYVAETFGAPPEDRWPYIAESRDLPEGETWKKLDDAAAKFRARAYRLSQYADISERLKLGQPVLAWVSISDGWTSKESSKTGLLKLNDKDEILGGHVIVIVGFNPADSSIKFANSWGVGWGTNGFGRMLAKDAQKSLIEMWAIDVPFSDI